jgi:hypothetical protein
VLDRDGALEVPAVFSVQVIADGVPTGTVPIAGDMMQVMPEGTLDKANV